MLKLLLKLLIYNLYFFFLQMRFCGIYLIVIFTLCTPSSSFKLKTNYIEVYDIGDNTLKQLPPQDPAVHSFPTISTVPLIPTCMKEGYFRDPFNCKKFYYCQYVNAVPKGFYCRSDLIFNTITDQCDKPNFVDCWLILYSLEKFVVQIFLTLWFYLLILMYDYLRIMNNLCL